MPTYQNNTKHQVQDGCPEPELCGKQQYHARFMSACRCVGHWVVTQGRSRTEGPEEDVQHPTPQHGREEVQLGVEPGVDLTGDEVAVRPACEARA